MIKVDIIKRIKAIEKQISNIEVPEFVMIYFDWKNNDWIVDEKVRPGDRNILHFKHYKDYVIHPKFEGTLIMDLLDCPEEMQIDLFMIDFSDFRKKHHLKDCGISMEAIRNQNDGILEQSFAVTVHE